jgi:uracil-DNA glycosylase
VLILGNTVLHTLTTLDGGITKHRGYVDKHKTAMPASYMYATFHPSAALRSTETRMIFEEDILAFATKIKSAYKDDTPSDD